MLDTNMVSLIMRSNPRVRAHLAAVEPSRICISSITEAELQFGLAKNPQAIKLRRAVEEFLLRVETRAFTRATALHYGRLRAALEASGKPLAALDTLIAAQALDEKCILVTNDAAFLHVQGLKTEDWSV